MKIQNQGFDHVEFVLNDIDAHAATYQRMGYEKIGERHLPKKGIRSVVWAQGFVRIMLSQPDGSENCHTQECTKFLNDLDEGISVLAIDVADATQAFQETVSRGAKPAMEPTRYESEYGSVVRAEIWTPGKVRYAFIERKTSGGNTGKALFDEGLVVSRLESPSPFGIRLIDHLTNNVSMGELKHWVQWYKDVFGFIVTRHFDISTGRARGLTPTSWNLLVAKSKSRSTKPPNPKVRFRNSSLA